MMHFNQDLLSVAESRISSQDLPKKIRTGANSGKHFFDLENSEKPGSLVSDVKRDKMDYKSFFRHKILSIISEYFLEV